MGGNRRSGKNKNVKIFAYLPSKVPYIFQIKDEFKCDNQLFLSFLGPP